jgi:hypothetical protein
VATDHWFDELHRTLTEEAPRRGLFRSTSALLGGLALGTSSQVGSAKKNRKGKKGKGKGNNKGKKDQKKDDPWGCEDRFQNLRIKDPNCSGGQCKASYPDDLCEEKYCEFVCNQCDGEDTRQFCISDILPGEKIAACCTDGAACFDGMCCGGFEHPELKCCQDGCKATNNDRENCGSCGNRCAPVENCVDGRCIDQCDQYCADTPGVSCCNGRCRNLIEDPANCGTCGHTCPYGHRCFEGVCRQCPMGEKYCSDHIGCQPDHFVCCGINDACAPPMPCCGSGDAAYCSRYVGQCVR